MIGVESPYEVPSDAFTTSSRSSKLPSRFGSAARSSAAPSMLVEPSQPKILSEKSFARGATPGATRKIVGLKLAS